MIKLAKNVNVGEFISVRGIIRGPVTMVEQSDTIPENTLIHYPGGMYECSGEVRSAAISEVSSAPRHFHGEGDY